MVSFFYTLALFYLASAIEIQRIPISGTPPAIRHQFTTAYSPQAETIVIYGGYSRDADIYTDFWFYNLKTELWTILNPTSTIQPDPRVQAASWIDEDAKILYIFGGLSSRGLLNDLWTCHLSSLSCKAEYDIGDIPSPRCSASYISFRDNDGNQRMMLFGGTSISALDNDLYELDYKTKTWIKHPKRGQVPYPRSAALISYSDGVLYIFGGEIIKNVDVVLPDNELYAYYLEEQTWKIIETKGEKPLTRYLGSSVVYNGYMYVFYGYNDEFEIDIDDFYRISLTTFEWEYVEIDRSSEYYNWFPRDAYGLVLHQDSIIIFGGWTYLGLSNILLIASLVTSTQNSPLIQFDIKLNNQLVPSPRSSHTMTTIGHKLYIFGGENAGNFYNDVWSFDTATEVWREVTAESWVPESRSRYCSASDGENIIIYGGKGKYGLLDDLLSFNTFTKVWSEYPNQADLKPAARSGACLAMLNPLIFIFGGTTRKGQTNDLWVYNTGTQTYEKLYSGEYSEPLPTQYASCKVLEEENDIFFYIMFGETLAETPQESIYKFSYFKRSWTAVYVPAFDVEYTRSMAAVNILNNRVLVAGGQVWGLQAMLDVRYLDLETFEYHDLGTLPQPMYANSYAYFKRTLYIHGGGDSFTLALRKGVSINSFFAINLDKNCEGEECDWPCSLGTYKNGESCEICPEGSYIDKLGSTECVPCPPGRYGRIKGASSQNMCYPCNEGFFNREEGQSSCLSCPSDKYCPIGTIEPIQIVYYSNYESNQPSVYAENLDKATYFTQIYAISFTLGILCFIVIVLFRKKLRLKLHAYDLYSTVHNYIVDEPMYIRKNMIGGLFTLIFIISALLFIFITVIQYLTNNIFEDKALVPFIIIAQDYEKISAYEVVLTTTLENFGASCTRDNSQTCSSLLQVTSQNLKGLTFISCRISDSDCIVEFKCINCEIETSGLVQIRSTERAAYSTMINLNVTSTSSIPDEKSSIRTYIEPGSTVVFIGNNPTKFYIQMTPSVFKSDAPDWDSGLTGFHVSQANNPEPGSVRVASEVPYSSNLNVDIYLEQNDAALLTYRKQKQTPLALVSGLLGTVFGIMGAVGGVMNFIEKRITMRNINKKHHDAKVGRVNRASEIIAELPYKSVSKYMKKDSYRYQKPREETKRSLEDIHLILPGQDSLTKENTPNSNFEAPDIINALPRAAYKFS